MASAKTEQERRDELVRRMAALRLQERQESRAEIAAAIYQYRGRAMSGGSSLLCPGDYMMLSGDDHYISSARGAKIDLGLDGLEKLVDAGALDHVFDAADLSSPDFEGKLDAILDKMAAQASYSDAYGYCSIHHRDVGPGYTMAMFSEDPKLKSPMAVVLQAEGEFACAAGRTVCESFADMGKSVLDDAASIVRQCTYEEFNPGAKNIGEELEKSANGERENMDIKFRSMRDEMLGTGSAVKDDIGKTDPDDKKAASGEAAKARADLKAALEDQERQQAENAELNTQDDLSLLAGSKAMRRIAD